MAIDRRTVLKFGLGGAGLLALGGVGLGLRGSVLRDPPAGLQVFGALEYSVLAAVAARVCPGSDDAPSADELDVAARVDAMLATLPPATGDEVKMVLRLLENALPGLLLDGRATTFTGSTPAVQDATLLSWQHSRVYARRAGYKALRGLCASAYFSDPRTYASCGYPGPPDFSRPVVSEEAG